MRFLIFNLVGGVVDEHAAAEATPSRKGTRIAATTGTSGKAPRSQPQHHTACAAKACSGIIHPRPATKGERGNEDTFKDVERPTLAAQSGQDDGKSGCKDEARLDTEIGADGKTTAILSHRYGISDHGPRRRCDARPRAVAPIGAWQWASN